MHLSRDQILNADDSAFEDVPVPEWAPKGAKKPEQVCVRVRAITGLERDRYEDSLITGRGKKRRADMSNARAKLVALAAVDSEGNRLFKPGDVEDLGRKSAAALNRVFEAAMRLAGLNDEDLDELTENFTDARSGDSTTN